MWLDCRLPTEEEWEYAARGGPQAIPDALYFFGDDPAKLDRWAWYGDPSRETPHPVSEFDKEGLERNLNPMGLANMLGNVWEWTADQYDDGEHIRAGGPTARRPIQVVKDERTLKGGTFKGSKDTVRCGRRVFANPTNRGSTVGFRLVRGRPDPA